MLRKYLIDYSLDVIGGDIVSCEKHKWACRRFLRDIEREGTDAFPFIFDEDKALKFLKWMTYFKHRKGVLAGEFIDPHPIQQFIFANIYGWVHKDTGYRRFKYAYWQVGRKNAKSQSLACVASYESSAFGEPSAEIYCAATKTAQAKLVWKETQKMIEGCEDLNGKFKVAYGVIEHTKSDSTISVLSKEDRKEGDGFNPQCGIIDEYHAHQTAEVYDIIESGMVARTQPLMMIITTAGFELAHPCYSVEYNYISKILEPDNPIENDEYFVMVNELDKDDDIKDERNWEKANPIVCSYPEGVAHLRGKLQKALDVPEKMRNYLTKNMNRWVDQKDNGYMAMDKWRDCGTNTIPELAGQECFVGIDLSSKIDLTSASFEFFIDGKYVVLSHSFMPEDTLAEKRKTDKMPYDLWVKQGWITTTPGAIVDYRFIDAYIKYHEQGSETDETDETAVDPALAEAIAVVSRYAEQRGWIIKEICYDPYNATQFAQELDTDGYECVEIRQGVKTLSEPTKDFRNQVYAGNESP